MLLEYDDASDSEQSKVKREEYGSYMWKKANHSNRLRQLVDEKISQFVLHPFSLDEVGYPAFINNETKTMVVTTLITLNVMSKQAEKS